MTIEEQRRVDDSFFRRIISGLIIAVVIEAASFTYYYGTLVERVDNIQDDVIALQVVFGSVANIDKNLAILRNKVDYLTNRIDKTAEIIEDIKSVQDRNSTIIKDSAEHIKAHR